MSEKTKLWLSFTAGIITIFGFHAIELLVQFPPLTEDMAEYCKQGNIHPDCNRINN